METSDPDDLSDAAAYLRAMAFHEAGHAVVAWSLDLPVGDIYICGIGEGNGGAQIGGAENLSFIARIAVCFAGIEAGNVFQSPQPSWAGNADCRMANQSLTFIRAAFLLLWLCVIAIAFLILKRGAEILSFGLGGFKLFAITKRSSFKPLSPLLPIDTLAGAAALQDQGASYSLQ